MWSTPGGTIRWLYFLTGRSEASKRRSLHFEAGRLSVVPTDGDADDRLRHYDCAVPVPGAMPESVARGLVIGNGDHVELIAERLGAGVSVEAALAGIDPEPDPPINTPRIAVVVQGQATIFLSVLLDDSVVRRHVTPVLPDPSRAYAVCTYSGDPARPTGDSPRFTIEHPGDDLPEQVWEALDPDRRVLLCAGSGSDPEPTTILS